MAKKVKKTAYQVAAEELNEVMGLKPAIDSSLDDAKLKPYLVKAIENVEDDDEFTEDTQEVIDELVAEAAKAKKAAKGKKEEAPAKGKGKKAPEPDPEEDEEEEEEEESDDDDDDEEEEQPEPVKPAKGKTATIPAAKGKTEAKETSDKPKAKGNFVAAEYTRVDAVCDALKAKPKTVASWSEKADALLEKKGGKANDKENKFVIKYVQKMAKHFDFGVTVPMA